jgi:hypothetical protein
MIQGLGELCSRKRPEHPRRYFAEQKLAPA